MNSELTKYFFLTGAAYFVCMAIAHFFAIKVPVLFVYYDTPFYAYQDKIISFSVCAYIGLFWSAAFNRSVAIVAIMVLAVTVLGLATVNMSEALASVLSSEQTTLPYWAQTIAISIYLAALVLLYIRDGIAQHK
ncbi:MAG: hypothetical protein KZQ77_07800 [Candidatus Thiodiazotropha sp. (ex Notomyrtea botanica)]|nr:hypothetical protein [Candidatus Thiodiazotropha sp. (ex Notomyrtea botanica)]